MILCDAHQKEVDIKPSLWIGHKNTKEYCGSETFTTVTLTRQQTMAILLAEHGLRVMRGQA